MDAETKSQFKAFLRMIFKQPVFRWLWVMMLILFAESFIPEDDPNRGLYLLIYAVSYTGAVIMFLVSLRRSRLATMRYLENHSLKYISTAISNGLGKVEYMIHVEEVDGFWRKLRVKLFGTSYVRPYNTWFFSDGNESMSAHIEIPVSPKKMFQLRLMGCIDTDSREHAIKGLKFLGVDWPLP